MIDMVISTLLSPPPLVPSESDLFVGKAFIVVADLQDSPHSYFKRKERKFEAVFQGEREFFALCSMMVLVMSIVPFFLAPFPRRCLELVNMMHFYIFKLSVCRSSAPPLRSVIGYFWRRLNILFC